MQNNSSLIIVAEYICEMEEKHGLFTHQIDGVYWWKLIRDPFSRMLVKSYSKKKQSNSVSKKASKLLSLDGIRKFTKNVKCFVKKTDTIIMENPRKILYDGVYIDPYTDDLVSRLRDSRVNYQIYQPYYARVTYKDQYDEKRRYIIPSISEYISRKLVLKFHPLELDENLVAMFEQLLERFNTKLDYRYLIHNAIIQFRQDEKAYYSLFKRSKASELYLICSYGKEGIISGAKKAGLKVIEIQHGLITRYHLGYCFPNDSVPYFPDQIHLWGDYFKQVMNAELIETKISGNQYLKNCVNQISSEFKTDILIISQPSRRDILVALARGIADTFPGLKVTYRTHPIEHSEEAKKFYQDSILPENIEVVFSEDHVYEQLYGSDIVIGCFSTVLIEALAFDCQVCVYGSDGLELLFELISEGLMTYIETLDDLNTLLGNKASHKILEDTRLRLFGF